METPWGYLVNAILNSTENSFIKGIQISTWHFNALEKSAAVPFIGLLKDDYEPFHTNYRAKYDAWIAQGGSQEGETLSLNQLLRLLSASKIRKWDIAIQGVYPNDTPKYKSLLANKRIPFQQGRQIERIEAVKALSIAIGTDAALAAVKADADLTYTQLSDVHNSQQGSKMQTSVFSQELEIARVEMATAQYKDLGMFIYEYAATPDLIAPYFDLKNIRHHQQVLFTGELAPLKDYCICKHGFAPGDEVEITNTGAVALPFYVAELKTNKPGEVFYNSLPGTKKRVTIGTLGNISNKFVKVFNPSDAASGSWEFEIL
jgi:hypothetical protein